MEEEKVNELKSTESIQIEEQRRVRGKMIIKWTESQDLSMYKWNPQRKREKKWGWKKYLKKSWWKFFNFDERHKFTVSWSSATPIRINIKKVSPKFIIVKVLKTKNKKQILKAEKNDTYIREHWFKWSITSHQK